IDTGRRQHARSDARTHAGLADRDDGLARVDAVRAELAQQPERNVERAGDVALVTLVLLPHVDHLYRVLFEQTLELVELDRLARIRHRNAGDVARKLEEADGAQPACGFVRLAF